MIFATVGSNRSFGFDRLLSGLTSIPGDELVVQYGLGECPPHVRHAVRWMSFPEMLDHFAKASKVVSHAGAGTILCAVHAGHVPIVLPRLRRFREAIDDHQLHLARALAQANRIILVEDVNDLAAGVKQAPPRGSASASTDTGLVAAVRAELHRP